jgi:hypothetical protein
MSDLRFLRQRRAKMISEKDLFTIQISHNLGSETLLIYELQMPDGSALRKNDVLEMVSKQEESSDSDLTNHIDTDAEYEGSVFNVKVTMSNALCQRFCVNKLVLFGAGRKKLVLTKGALDARSRPPEPGTVRSRLNA